MILTSSIVEFNKPKDKSKSDTILLDGYCCQL